MIFRFKDILVYFTLSWSPKISKKVFITVCKSIFFCYIVRFLIDLSRFFKFCSDELIRKCKLIEELIEIDQAHYSTVNSAVEFEKSVGVHERHNMATVCLLRLMRGLDFTRRLMDDAYVNLDTKKKCYDIAWEAYQKTLGPRQKWTARHTIKVGFRVLPKKKDMVDFMLRGSPAYKNYHENDHILKDFLSVIHKVYYLVHKTFYENDFLELVD